MEIVIRPYREDDEADVVRFSLRAWDPVHASMKDVLGAEIFDRLYRGDWRRQQEVDIKAVLADEQGRAWVAEVDGKVGGFVAAIRREGPLGEVTMVAVDPDLQGYGLGTRLTEVATDWIRDQGLSVAMISTGGDDGHAPARHTYEKAGYTAFPAVNYFKAL